MALTVNEVIAQLQAFVAANPEAGEMPFAFTCNDDKATIEYPEFIAFEAVAYDELAQADVAVLIDSEDAPRKVVSISTFF